MKEYPQPDFTGLGRIIDVPNKMEFTESDIAKLTECLKLSLEVTKNMNKQIDELISLCRRSEVKS